MPVPVADCPVALIGCELKKDGHKVTLFVPKDAIPRLLLDADMGTKFMAAFALYTEAEATPDVVLRTYPNEGVREINEGFLNESRSAVEATNEKGSEGSQLRPAAGRVLSSAERAIINAHKYADGNKEILDDIHVYCGVPTCADFKTDPKALARFHDWEYINGYVQGRP